MDPPGRGVRFAGYPTSARGSPMVICEVTMDALRAIGGLPETTPEELEGIFELHKVAILEIASAKFERGEYRPIVTAGDFVAESA